MIITALALVAGAVLRFWLDMLSPALTKIQTSEELGGETRIFVVEDPFIVKVPGLTTLTGVMIDGIRLPLVEDRPFQQVKPDKEPETVYEPMTMVELRYSDEDGPHLIRSEFSNDGRWQVGSTLVVGGEWDDNPETFASSIDLEEKDAEIAKLKEKAKADQAKKDAEIAKLKEKAKADQAKKDAEIANLKRENAALKKAKQGSK